MGGGAAALSCMRCTPGHVARSSLTPGSAIAQAATLYPHPPNNLIAWPRTAPWPVHGRALCPLCPPLHAASGASVPTDGGYLNLGASPQAGGYTVCPCLDSWTFRFAQPHPFYGPSLQVWVGWHAGGWVRGGCTCLPAGCGCRGASNRGALTAALLMTACTACCGCRAGCANPNGDPLGPWCQVLVHDLQWGMEAQLGGRVPRAG